MTWSYPPDETAYYSERCFIEDNKRSAAILKSGTTSSENYINICGRYEAELNAVIGPTYWNKSVYEQMELIIKVFINNSMPTETELADFTEAVKEYLGINNAEHFLATESENIDFDDVGNFNEWFDFEISTAKSGTLGPDYVMCCDQPKEVCSCPVDPDSIIYTSPPLSFVQVYERIQKDSGITVELAEEAYAYDAETKSSPCESCEYHGTYNCVPLRSWLREIDQSYSVDQTSLSDAVSYIHCDSIEPCEDYSPSKSTTRDEVQHIVDKYIKIIFDTKQDEIDDDTIIILEEENQCLILKG